MERASVMERKEVSRRNKCQKGSREPRDNAVTIAIANIFSIYRCSFSLPAAHHGDTFYFTPWDHTLDLLTAHPAVCRELQLVRKELQGT